MEKIKIQGFKYHKFIKNFGLFALAVINSVYAAFYFSGIMYGRTPEGMPNSEIMYAIYGNGLRVLDIVNGCLFCVGTILALIARQQLAKKIKSGVYVTFALLIYEGVFPFVYPVWAHFIMDTKNVIHIKNVIFLLIFASLALVTFKYYGKREEMFKN